MAEQDPLTAALAGYLTGFRQRRWFIREGLWRRSRLAFLHAKKKHRYGVDEAIVSAKENSRGNILIQRHVLLHDEEDWRRCDEAAFKGFLREGERGLSRGVARMEATGCSCGRLIHRSGGRARVFAEELARQYGKTGVQRPYRCPENVLVFHLTAQEKGSRRPIPDAYIENLPWRQ